MPDDLFVCVCGERHPILNHIGDVPVVECPWAPPGQVTLINGRRVSQRHMIMVRDETTGSSISIVIGTVPE